MLTFNSLKYSFLRANSHLTLLREFQSYCWMIRCTFESETFYCFKYSIVKDSSADLGVNFKIVQNRPTVKAVCTKISKKNFCIFANIFVFLRENKEASFFIFWIFKLKQPWAKPELLLIMGLFWTLSFQRSNPHYCP